MRNSGELGLLIMAEFWRTVPLGLPNYKINLDIAATVSFVDETIPKAINLIDSVYNTMMTFLSLPLTTLGLHVFTVSKSELN